jgi:hypothetical protein
MLEITLRALKMLHSNKQHIPKALWVQERMWQVLIGWRQQHSGCRLAI